MEVDTKIEHTDEKKESEPLLHEKSSSAITPDMRQEDNSSVASSSRKHTSPVPPSGSNTVRSNPPLMITNSVPIRPPSTTSMHSNGSGTVPARTTIGTSRRGGRTRSRSPPMMVQRPASTSPSEPYIPTVAEDRGAVAPPSPGNPSAAAAAAAAVAKSITRNPPPPSAWYDSPEAREQEYRRSQSDVRYHGSRPAYYEGGLPPPPRQQWPEQEEGGAGARPPSRNRYPPSRRPGEEHSHYGYREGYSYRGRSSGGEPFSSQYEGAEDYDRRYAEQRGYDDRQPQSTSPPQPPGYDYSRGRDHHRQPSHPSAGREDSYYKPGYPPKELEGGGRPAPGAHTSVKRTTRVIGTATPIHMPRAGDSSSSRNGSSSGSIFRGRPGDNVRKPPAVGTEEDSTRKINVALRTPSTSFEEKPMKSGSNTTKRGSGDPLSPEAPPRIQQSHLQGTSESTLFFEPQRSPKSAAGPPQPTSSIDMAPSFTLFNQSFDSIGDTANFFSVSGPLDAALQSTSFGAGPIPSEDKGEIQLSSSVGNFSQQLLGRSGSGALTFEMSPSNSFGNVPPPAMRTSNMMVLGGQDHRSSSPSQVLDMYRSYSGGGSGAGPSPRPVKGGSLEDSHLRMSGSILAAPSLSQSYTRSFAEAPPGQYRSGGVGQHAESPDGAPGFYMFLKRHKGAFMECSFLLPGLKAALLQASDVKQEGVDETPKRHTRSGDPYGEPNPQDIAISLRRIAAAVCAFGGTNLGDRLSISSRLKPNPTKSIFREKPGDAATVTPNSSSGNSPGSYRSRQRAKYDEALPGRYYENDNRLSWEFEENPPIDDMGKDEEEADELKREEDMGDHKSSDGDGRKKGDGDSMNGSGDGKKTPTGSKDGDQPKMRYRCKLCGQPKQNHTCPYQQSLARSIGTMVYPAVNAFTSAEPGSLAPALSEMNNFVLSGDDSVSSADASPSRPTPDRLRRTAPSITQGTAQVTPESMRGTPRAGNSPVTTPQRARTPTSSRRSRGSGSNHGDLPQRRFQMGGGTPGSSAASSASKKRGHGQMSGADDQGDLLFVEAAELKPEQFRIVTASKIVTSPDAFTYPALPLPYAQRKRLSDNLFSLSKQVPQLTDECAAVLREAREKDLWDLAVAELMTQVVVVVHCHDADSRFEGLRRYLLTLGISC